MQTNNRRTYRQIAMIIMLIYCSNLLFAQKTPKVLFVIADGIPTDVIEKHPSPHLRSIISSGSFLHAYVGGARGGETESPTISAVGYNSLLTGTWANKHNVWDNSIAKPNYRYPTIFRLFKDQYPQKQIGIFSTWLDNRTKLAGEGLRKTKRLKFDYISDGHELDTITYPHDADKKYIHLIDERVVADAAEVLKKQAPHLSWVYLEYTDDMGHQWGDGPQLNQAISFLDVQLGKLWEAIQYREQYFDEDWLLLITTDHGRDSIIGKGHGGQSDRERSTWIVSNKKFIPRSSPAAVVDLLPTMADHFQLNIPNKVRRRLDGISLY